jgi:replicative DNA helicase
MSDVIDISQYTRRYTEAEKQGEQASIGSAMLDNANFIAALSFGVEPQSFKCPEHQQIWAAMGEAYAKEERCDIVTVSEVMEERKILEPLGGLAYLALLVDMAEPNKVI